MQVQSKFRICFGREDKVYIPQEGAVHAREIHARKKQRTAITTVKTWGTFTPALYKSHHEKQLLKKWAAYLYQLLAAADKKDFFKTVKLCEQLESHYDTDAAAVTFDFRNIDVVDGIVGKLLLADVADDEDGYRA